MPWARLDDRFPSNRKIRLLSDAEFRLYVSAICWSSENLTDGRIRERELPLISDVRRPFPAASRLVAEGLWEKITDGWVIHDYAEYNPTSEQVRAERKKAAARQQSFRDRKALEEAAQKAEEEAARNAVTGGVTEGVSNGGSHGAPPRPDPLRSSYGTTAAAAGAGESAGADSHAHLPPEVVPLVDGLAAAGFGAVAWDLNDDQWTTIRRAIERSGIPALIEYARRRHRSSDPAFSARAWVRGWSALPALNVGAALEPAARVTSEVSIPSSRNAQIVAAARERAQAATAAWSQT